MEIVKVFILTILFLGCSEKQPLNDSSRLNTGKDIPTPKSYITTTNPKEDLAPQTCYYGCKARK